MFEDKWVIIVIPEGEEKTGVNYCMNEVITKTVDNKNFL